MSTRVKLGLLLLLALQVAGCGGKRDVILDVHKDVKSLNLRGNEMYFKGKYDDAARFYDRAKVMSISIDDRVGLAESLNNLGQLYLVAGDLSSALKKFEDAKDINSEIKNGPGEAANLNNLGSVYLKMKDFVRAEESFDAAMAIYREKSDNVGKATVLNNIGKLNIEGENLKEAEKNILEALKIAAGLKRHRLSASCYENLGMIRELEGDHKTSLEDYKRALEEDKLVEYSPGIAGDLENIADEYLILDMSGEAFEFYDRALSVNMYLGFKEGIKRCLTKLSDISRLMENREASEDYLNRLKKIQDKKGSRR